MEFRRQHGYDTEAASSEAVVVNDSPSLTVQSMAEDADLNVLMERMKVTGKFPENPRPMTFGDFDEIFDYQSALNGILDAQERFMEFPAKVRARFENNPQRMLEFFADGRNIEEARSLGLVKEKVGERVSGAGSASAGAGVGGSVGGAGAPQSGAAAASSVQPGGGQAAVGAGVGSGSSAA